MKEHTILAKYCSHGRQFTEKSETQNVARGRGLRKTRRLSRAHEPFTEILPSCLFARMTHQLPGCIRGPRLRPCARVVWGTSSAHVKQDGSICRSDVRRFFPSPTVIMKVSTALVRPNSECANGLLTHGREKQCSSIDVVLREDRAGISVFLEICESSRSQASELDGPLVTEWDHRVLSRSRRWQRLGDTEKQDKGALCPLHRLSRASDWRISSAGYEREIEVLELRMCVEEYKETRRENGRLCTVLQTMAPKSSVHL